MVIWTSNVSTGRPAKISLRYQLLLLSVILNSTRILPNVADASESFYESNHLNDYKNPHQNFYEINDNDVDNTIRTDGCTIPALQPFHEVLSKFVRSKQPRPCKDAENIIISRNRTHLWIEYFKLVMHDIPFNTNLTCCYQSFHRPVKNKVHNKDNAAEYGECFWFNDVLKATDEFVRVKCYHKKKLYHQSFHLFAIDVLQPRELALHSPYNVLILGIDNISRLNFHRTMPKTYHYLRERGAIELFGYNKVGDNTFPNIIPMLTGLESDELAKTCCTTQKTFDDCPFVWNSFREAGFYTALGEDSSLLGTFNYLKKGFDESPTDYYLRTFIHEAERNVGNNKDSNSYICLGDKYSYAVLLDYIEHLSSALRSSKLFGFFWEVTMSHDFLTYPNIMDEHYETLLRKLNNSSYLDETIVIILSDHGIRWGDIQKTKQGRLEERLPMVNFLLPHSFQHRYQDAYQNLLLNRHRLTTPYDIHATLLDLANIQNINTDNIAVRRRQNYNSRSISLFLPIPFNRTCQMANIDKQWCTCQQEVHHSRITSQSQHLVSHVINYLNYLIKEQHQCAKLKLRDIKDITQMSVGEAERQAKFSWQEYKVVIDTTPGDAIFEAILRRKTIKGRPDGDWKVTKINRINAYINQSQCVQDYQLKQYCFCLNKYSKNDE